MGGKGSGRRPSEETIVRRTLGVSTGVNPPNKLVLPNYSGAANAVEDDFIKKGGDTYSGDYTNTSGDLTLTNGDLTLTNGDIDLIDGRLELNDTNASTGITNVLVLGHDTTTTPADGIGVGIRFNAETSTTPGSQCALWRAFWDDVNHATRTSKLLYSTFNNGSTVTPLSVVGNKVGINTATPTETLQVVGDINVQEITATSLTMGAGDIVSAGDATLTGDLSCANAVLSGRLDVDAESGQNTPTLNYGLGTVNDATQHMEHTFYNSVSSSGSGSTATSIYTLTNDETATVKCTVSCITNGGSQGVGIMKAATFRKDGAAAAVQIGTTSTIYSHTNFSPTFTVGLVGSVVTITLTGTTSGLTYYWTIKTEILSSI